MFDYFCNDRQFGSLIDVTTCEAVNLQQFAKIILVFIDTQFVCSQINILFTFPTNHFSSSSKDVAKFQPIITLEQNYLWFE